MKSNLIDSHSIHANHTYMDVYVSTYLVICYHCIQNMTERTTALRKLKFKKNLTLTCG